MYARCVFKVKPDDVELNNADLVELFRKRFGLRPHYGLDGKTAKPLELGEFELAYGSAGYHKLQLQRAYENLNLPNAIKAEVKTYGIMLGVIPESQSTLIFTRLSVSRIGLIIIANRFDSLKDASSRMIRVSMRIKIIDYLPKIANNKASLQISKLSDSKSEVVVVHDDYSDDPIFRGYRGARLAVILYNNTRDAILAILLLLSSIFLMISYPQGSNQQSLAVNFFAAAVTLLISVILAFLSANIKPVHWETT